MGNLPTVQGGHEQPTILHTEICAGSVIVKLQSQSNCKRYKIKGEGDI